MTKQTLQITGEVIELPYGWKIIEKDIAADIKKLKEFGLQQVAIDRVVTSQNIDLVNPQRRVKLSIKLPVPGSRRHEFYAYNNRTDRRIYTKDHKIAGWLFCQHSITNYISLETEQFIDQLKNTLEHVKPHPGIFFYKDKQHLLQVADKLDNDVRIQISNDWNIISKERNEDELSNEVIENKLTLNNPTIHRRLEIKLKKDSRDYYASNIFFTRKRDIPLNLDKQVEYYMLAKNHIKTYSSKDFTKFIPMLEESICQAHNIKPTFFSTTPGIVDEAAEALLAKIQLEMPLSELEIQKIASMPYPKLHSELLLAEHLDAKITRQHCQTMLNHCDKKILPIVKKHIEYLDSLDNH